ncbi:MAG: hypothetical protein WC829_13685 [Hyphomicrobium sp.]|jgi:hypothetical protein
MRNHGRLATAIADGLLIIGLLTGAAAAQEWSPFDSLSNPARGAAKPPVRASAPTAAGDDTIRPLGNEGSSAVERGDLAPVLAPDGSGLPYELWRGLNVASLEQLISEIEIPPRSPALHALWLRLITSNVTRPDGGVTDQQFLALRLEILYRSGLLEEASRLIAGQANGDPAVTILAARNEIGLGAKERGCETAKSAGAAPAQLPKPIRADAALISGYCAAIAGDAAGAGLAAELAREDGAKQGPGLAALDALSIGGKPQVEADQQLALLDYRLIEAAGGSVDAEHLRKRATPGLLAAIALDTHAGAGDRLAAAEAAAEVNAISPQQLADVYRSQSAGEGVASDAGGRDTPQRRAALFTAAEHEQTPQKKVRLIRSFLDEAHRAGFYLTALHMMAPAADAIFPAPEIGWFAETGIEAAMAAGNYSKARIWAAFGSSNAGGNGLNHWLALIDIAEGANASGDEDLRYVEELAVRGRMDPTLLHRLATVLDALDYNVPIPLWEAASRTPQPTSGYLPETGVLTELQNAAKKREFGRTVLLAMKTLGPNGAEGAHMIALGDSIRALRRAGLDADARALGFEALFAGWPRAIVN